jgi:hypothetical protein
MRITCDRCGTDRMVNEAHAAGWRDRTLSDILSTCATTAVAADRAELLTASRAPAAGRGQTRRLPPLAET